MLTKADRGKYWYNYSCSMCCEKEESGALESAEKGTGLVQQVTEGFPKEVTVTLRAVEWVGVDQVMKGEGSCKTVVCIPPRHFCSDWFFLPGIPVPQRLLNIILPVLQFQLIYNLFWKNFPISHSAISSSPGAHSMWHTSQHIFLTLF